MNKNILSPKGTINQTLFIIYHLFLTSLYLLGGIYLLFYVYKNNLNSLYFMWPLLIVKVLIAFNYKKRIMDILNNLPLAVILAFLLTFDITCLAACQFIKNPQTSMVTFFAGIIFILLIQPAIVALIPPKNEE
ncbi:MAG: hypothetical protein K2F57_02810 [Candidatus Gastranaerophilales bacterium]|nr:hypothetical protein [Candidatus Gastranaerophilales bacterium]